MNHPDASFEPESLSELSELNEFSEEALDPTGALAWATSLVGLGTVGLVSLLQIIGLLT